MICLLVLPCVCATSIQELLGESLIPFVIWLCSRRRLQEDIIIHECTRHYDYEIFLVWLGETHTIKSMVLSPTNFRFPVLRSLGRNGSGVCVCSVDVTIYVSR